MGYGFHQGNRAMEAPAWRRCEAGSNAKAAQGAGGESDLSKSAPQARGALSWMQSRGR
jgi:hypothetical protein